MRAEILTDFDRACETLESLATFAGLDHGAVGAWLLQDTATMRRFGVETLVPRWIRRPLVALRAFEEARREATLALEGVRDGLAGIESRLIGLRAAGKRAEAQTLEREAARLLCFEADLRERLAPPDAELVEQARQGITRVLEISMPILARAIERYADAALDGEPGEARRALKHVEAYLGLAERAMTVTGGLDVPALRPDYLARLGAASGADAATRTAGRPPGPRCPLDPRPARGAPLTSPGVVASPSSHPV